MREKSTHLLSETAAEESVQTLSAHADRSKL